MSETNLLFIKITVADGATPPVYKKPGDAGADLALDLSDASKAPKHLSGTVAWLDDGGSLSQPGSDKSWRVHLYPGEAAWFQTGVAFELPEGVEGQIRPRSSSHNLGLLVGHGTIDSGYRGPVSVHIRNVGEDMVTLRQGQRVAQIVFAPVYSARFEVVPALNATARGTDGFGSTGS